MARWPTKEVAMSPVAKGDLVICVAIAAVFFVVLLIKGGGDE